MSRPLLSLRVGGLALLAAGALFLSSCKDDPIQVDPPLVTNYNAFAPNLNYNGQTVRLLLIDSLLTRIKQLDDAGAGSVTKADLEAIFDNSNGLFADLAAGKKLSDKVSTKVDPMMVSQLRSWFDSLATRSMIYAGSADAVTTSDGIYLVEAIEKSLMGSVLYAQAIEELRTHVPDANNNTVIPGEGTEMQHEWDEAFGYFGASRDYLDRDSAYQRRASIDVNNDGKIDPASERSFYFARYAATVDTQFSTFTSSSLQLGNTIVRNFIVGRQAIGENNLSKVTEAANAILNAWDKVIAANAVRYGGVIKKQIADGKGYNGQWAELKGFVDMTQYNGTTLLNAAKYAEVKALIGTKPADLTTQKVDQVVAIIKSAYNF